VCRGRVYCLGHKQGDARHFSSSPRPTYPNHPKSSSHHSNPNVGKYSRSVNFPISPSSQPSPPLQRSQQPTAEPTTAAGSSKQQYSPSSSSKWPELHPFQCTSLSSDRMESIRTRPQRVGDRTSGDEGARPLLSFSLISPFNVFPGTYSTPRRRATILRKRKAGSLASHKNARVRPSSGTVSVRSGHRLLILNPPHFEPSVTKIKTTQPTSTLAHPTNQTCLTPVTRDNIVPKR
jgi:hypothetical protein